MMSVVDSTCRAGKNFALRRAVRHDGSGGGCGGIGGRAAVKGQSAGVGELSWRRDSDCWRTKQRCLKFKCPRLSLRSTWWRSADVQVVPGGSVMLLETGSSFLGGLMGGSVSFFRLLYGTKSRTGPVWKKRWNSQKKKHLCDFFGGGGLFIKWQWWSFIYIFLDNVRLVLKYRWQRTQLICLLFIVSYHHDKQTLV